jgi:hypothetical protein
MKRLLPLLFALLLSGCYWNQKQQIVDCALEAGQHSSLERIPDGFPRGSFYIEECMRAHGYVLNREQCPELLREKRLDPATLDVLSKELRRVYIEQTEKQNAVLAGWQKVEVACYEPTGWFGKRVLRTEKWLWISN